MPWGRKQKTKKGSPEDSHLSADVSKGQLRMKRGSKFPVCRMFINVDGASPAPVFQHSGLEFGT